MLCAGAGTDLIWTVLEAAAGVPRPRRQESVALPATGPDSDEDESDSEANGLHTADTVDDEDEVEEAETPGLTSENQAKLLKSPMYSEFLQ